MSDLLRVRVSQDSRGQRRVILPVSGAFDRSVAVEMMDELSRVAPHSGDVIVVQLPEATVLDAVALCTLFFVDGYVRARGGGLTISMPLLDAKEARRLRRHFSFEASTEPAACPS